MAEPIHCRIIACFAADTLLYDVTLTSDPWPWPLIFLALNMCSVSRVTWWNSVPNLNAIEQYAAELLRFQCLTLWPWTCFKCCARLWIIFTKFDLRQLIRAWIIAFLCWYLMSCCDLDLCPVDLESSWYIKRHVIKICTKFERNRAMTDEIGRIIDNFAIFLHTLCHAVTLTFDLWPFDVELLGHVGCHAFKLCTKFERNRIIYGWVIDDLALFRVQF